MIESCRKCQYKFYTNEASQKSQHTTMIGMLASAQDHSMTTFPHIISCLG